MEDLAGAKISAFPLDAAISGGIARQPVTDQNGKFRYVLPAYPGRTRLCAIKESAGYPDTQGLLFASPGENIPEVSLVPGGHLENVDIHLGSPDGILEGSIVDGVTGAQVPKARITLHRSEPESMYSTSLGPDGSFLLALPQAPIELSVIAPGYQPWKYKDALTGLDKVVIHSTDRRSIVVALTPK
jgi:Carboxypeptidase regulatory-like domain